MDSGENGWEEEGCLLLQRVTLHLQGLARSLESLEGVESLDPGRQGDSDDDEMRVDFVVDVSRVSGDIYVRPHRKDIRGRVCGIALDH